MPWCRWFILGLMLQAFAILPAAAAKRVALVIGNSAYVQAPALTNPVNDAADMAKALTEAGFDVVLGLDLDRRAFDDKLRTFARSVDGADIAVLFYAGHGLQVTGHNYLVPVDASLASERDLDFEAVSLDFVLRQMEVGREGKTSIVFLDACRNNPLSRNLARSMGTRSAAVGQGLAEVQTGVGTFIAYSTQPGNVALDGAGRNSPFTQALAAHVVEAGKNLTAIMIEVRNDVLKATERPASTVGPFRADERFLLPGRASSGGRTGAPRSRAGDRPGALACDRGAGEVQVRPRANACPCEARTAQGTRAPARRVYAPGPATHFRYV